MIQTKHRVQHSKNFTARMKRLGALCKKRRLAKDMTLGEVAAAVGCSFQRVSDIEKGDTPSLQTYLNLCLVLNEGKSMLQDC